MATTYSTLYHTPTSFNHKNNSDDIFLHKCFTTKEDTRHTRRFSVDSLYTNKRRKYSEPTFNPPISSTPRTRKTSSILRDIIVESISESMEVEQKRFENNNNITSGVDDHHGTETKTPSSKKIYKHRKHHSDLGVAFNVEKNDVTKFTSSRTDSFSEEEEYDETDGGENLKVTAAERKIYHRHSGSGLDLLLNHDVTGPGRIRKASSHMDITSTQMYKDIYADNLRQYGFIVAKQLGLGQRSPDQLRKTYVKSRQKALERRDRTNSSLTDNVQHERRDSLSLITRDRSSTTSSIASNDSNVSDSSRKLSNASIDLRGNKYTKSLTDISNISILEKHRKPTTTVIRRKKGNKLPTDPTKRLSAPIINGAAIADLETMSVSQLRKQIASMSVPDLSRSCSPTIIETTPEEITTELTPPQHNHHPRKLSDETSQRHKDAKARNEWRMSRIKSFEGVLSQASSWIKDVKTKTRSGSKQNIDNEDQET